MTAVIFLRIVLLLLIVGAGYWFWLRPILRQRPGFKELYDREESFFAALSDRFAGIKQKLAGAVMTIACAVVAVWEQFVPMLAGVDTSSITDLIPPKAWPFIMIAGVLMLQYFRRLADKRNEE